MGGSWVSGPGGRLEASHGAALVGALADAVGVSGNASYHFVDSVTAAIDRAQELAGERTIAVSAGELGGQILAAGLVDEVAMDLVPVVFGSGRRYFGGIDGQHLLEDPHVVIQGDRVLHLRFKVRR
jgi:dihydrofolate reductase